jgi:addiction module RelE/StbE family toxin
MIIYFHRTFRKKYSKLKIKQKNIAEKRLSIFKKDEFNFILNNHSLLGKYRNYRSINISGNIRAIYKKIDEDSIIFTEIGTHSELYK